MATFIEKYQGTAVARNMVYHSALFFVLQALMVVNFLLMLLRHQRLRKGRWGLWISHFAFMVILTGALTTHLFSKEGIMHLREGETSHQFLVRTGKGNTVHTLPFSVELERFTLTRYPGSASPASFESQVVVHADGASSKERIYMNNVLDVKGYRFFQTSYDPDECGTVLAVNFDVAGRRITYAGYVILLVGFLLCLLGRKSRFMRLRNHLKELRNAEKPLCVCLLFACTSFCVEAHEDASAMMQTVQHFSVSRVHAEKFGALPMQSGNGRMMPVNTFSSEVLRKLHKSDRFGSLSADQFLISVMAMPEVWMRVPLIAVTNAELARCFGLTEGTCAYTEFFDGEGNYRLQQKLSEAYGREYALRSRFDKDLIRLDERVNLFNRLIHRQGMNVFPREGDPDLKWYAPGDDLSVFEGKDSMFVSRIMDWYLMEVDEAVENGDWTKADEIVEMIATYQQAKGGEVNISPRRLLVELTYNKMHVFRWCRIGYLALGGLLLIFSFVLFFRQNRWLKVLVVMLGVGVLAVCLFHMTGMGMRWYIGGYAPWSNSYETMVYVSWTAVCGGLWFARRSVVTFALATLLAGVVLFVSGLNWMDPQITPLVPVLNSPWLMFHVAVIVAAYGFFGIGALLGLTNLVLMAVASKRNATFLKMRIAEWTIINEMALWVGLAFMTIGTFLGAVWANESWGRYWGWDPKETWALITVVCYAVVTHLHLLRRGNHPWLFNLSSVLAFASVLMTFFGVNYFLSGMHSYGRHDDAQGVSVYLFGALAFVLVLALVSYIKWATVLSEDAMKRGNGLKG